MNSPEFDTELRKLCARAITEGVQCQKMGMDQVVGLLELHKAGVIKFMHDSANQAQIQPVRFRLPPNGGSSGS